MLRTKLTRVTGVRYWKLMLSTRQYLITNLLTSNICTVAFLSQVTGQPWTALSFPIDIRDRTVMDIQRNRQSQQTYSTRWRCWWIPVTSTSQEHESCWHSGNRRACSTFPWLRRLQQPVLCPRQSWWRRRGDPLGILFIYGLFVFFICRPIGYRNLSVYWIVCELNTCRHCVRCYFISMHIKFYDAFEHLCDKA